MRTDPRVRQSLNRLSSSVESGVDTLRTGCFHISSTYLDPCLSSLTACLTPRHPRAARRPSHRSEHSTYPFAFYGDNWDCESDDEPASASVLTWSNGELDRLLAGSDDRAGSYHHHHQGRAGGGLVGAGAAPRMHYGTRKDPGAGGDPTVIPGTRLWGFLSAFGMGGRGMRYKPSAANLQEHPVRGAGEAAGRRRAGSGASSGTGESFRSRRDLWPSEDEDDAVVLGDEALLLSAGSSGGEGAAGAEGAAPAVATVEVEEVGLSEEELRREEERAALEEEEELERRREAARRLAVKRGLSTENARAKAAAGPDAEAEGGAEVVEVVTPRELEKGKGPAARAEDYVDDGPHINHFAPIQISADPDAPEEIVPRPSSTASSKHQETEDKPHGEDDID